MPAAAGWLITMLFIIVGWVIFRAADFSSAAAILGSMAGLNGFDGKFSRAGLILAGLLVSVIVPAAYRVRSAWLIPHPAFAITTAILTFVCILEVGKGAPQSFIYFQF
jgi:alginate O-acetyltransferase complex protein AlgI